ncbi:hypothetical protein QCA50_017475 [Cerrena zonata]|uniref:Uncharacterized protein n=1 Tax=Cerrena zonata TaxID=2478898 RepID=A0AAW0FF94_9APHY
MQCYSSRLLALIVAVAPAAIMATPIDPTGLTGAATSNELARRSLKLATVWTDSNRGGKAKDLLSSAIPTSCFNLDPPFADSISSIEVESGFLCTFYIDASCSGGSMIIENGEYYANLIGTQFQDSISSFSCSSCF